MEAEDYFLLGRGLLARGQVGPGLASLGAARDAQPDHAETLDALSPILDRNPAMTDAADAAERLVRQPGWEVRGEVRLGRLRAELFDPAGAASRSAGGPPTRPEAHAVPTWSRPRPSELLARCWLQAGRPAEARAWLHDRRGPTARSRGGVAPEPRLAPGGEADGGGLGPGGGRRIRAPPTR